MNVQSCNTHVHAYVLLCKSHKFLALVYMYICVVFSFYTVHSWIHLRKFKYLTEHVAISSCKVKHLALTTKYAHIKEF